MTIAVKEVKQAKPLPAPNSDFYQLADVLTAEEKAIVKKVRDIHGEPRSSRSSTSTGPTTRFRSSCCRPSRNCSIGGLGYEGYGCAGGSQKLFGFVAMEIARVDASFCDVLRRAQRPGDGLDLPRRIGGAEAEMAAADGALGKDRLLRPHRAAGGFGNQRRPDDDREARRRHLDSQRPEAVDRQRAVVRHLDHLGARSRRQPGQGLHRREQDDARLQRREDRAQDRAQSRPERPDHAEGRAGAGSEPPAGRQLVPRHRARCCG